MQNQLGKIEEKLDKLHDKMDKYQERLVRVETHQGWIKWGFSLLIAIGASIMGAMSSLTGK